MKTKLCKGPCGEYLPLCEFSAAPATADRLQPMCKGCRARRQWEVRNAHREQYERKASATYLERHLARRAEEATYLREKQESSPIPERGLLLISPETDSAFRGMIDSFLPLPTVKNYWIVK